MRPKKVARQACRTWTSDPPPGPGPPGPRGFSEHLIALGAIKCSQIKGTAPVCAGAVRRLAGADTVGVELGSVATA